MPRYDHITCPVMKARYNCAIPKIEQQQTIRSNETTANTSEEASDYKFVWRKAIDDQWCDLQALTDFIQGPAGLPNRSVLIQGNSFLRQIWEAMVCGFRTQMTNLTLLTGGRPTSKEYIASRKGKPFQKDELGAFLVNQHKDPPGCHAPGNDPLESYYDKAVMVPPNIDDCSDDMAMVEFQQGLRVFFLFHPSRLDTDALVEAYSNLDVPDRVDVMMWNDVLESKVSQNRTLKSRGDTLPLKSLLPSIRQIQETSIGAYFGASNPWIDDPPDTHPCLPGIPDDEVNIVFYLLLLDEYERNNGLP